MGMGIMSKKRRRKTYRRKGRLPFNLNYWRFVVKTPKDLEAFLDHGSRSQQIQLLDALKYFKTAEEDLYAEVKGEHWLGLFKKAVKK